MIHWKLILNQLIGEMPGSIEIYVLFSFFRVRSVKFVPVEDKNSDQRQENGKTRTEEPAQTPSNNEPPTEVLPGNFFKVLFNVPHFLQLSVIFSSDDGIGPPH